MGMAAEHFQRFFFISILWVLKVVWKAREQGTAIRTAIHARPPTLWGSLVAPPFRLRWYRENPFCCRPRTHRISLGWPQNVYTTFQLLNVAYWQRGWDGNGVLGLGNGGCRNWLANSLFGWKNKQMKLIVSAKSNIVLSKQRVKS